MLQKASREHVIVAAIDNRLHQSYALGYSFGVEAVVPLPGEFGERLVVPDDLFIPFIDNETMVFGSSNSM